MTKDFIVPIELQSIDSSTLNPAAYTEIGNPLYGPLFMIRFTNATSEDVYISFDGINDHYFVGSGDRFPLYFQGNTRYDCDGALLAKGTIIYARGVAGQGNFYVAGYYNG